MKGGRAVGVALANGEEIYGKTVVSNLDPKRTYLKLIEKSDLDAIDPDIHGYARNFKIRGSSGKLNIALDGLPQFAGCPKEKRLGHHRYRRRFRLHRACFRTITNTARGPSGPSSTS